MRIIFNICLLFIMVLFNSSRCSAQKLKDCDSLYIEQKHIIKEVDLYEIDSAFYKYLDTVIINEVKYSYYNNCYSAFLYSTSIVKPINSDIDEIIVASINKYLYDYSKCYGIFEYSGMTFICDSLCNKELLHSTEKKIPMKYLLTDKYLSQRDIDDSYSTWYFVYKNHAIFLTGHYYPFY